VADVDPEAGEKMKYNDKERKVLDHDLNVHLVVLFIRLQDTLEQELQLAQSAGESQVAEEFKVVEWVRSIGKLKGNESWNRGKNVSYECVL
jgi:hypothetical protein